MAEWSISGYSANAFYGRPLVLIQNPVNREQVQVGQDLIVHATARNSGGVDRMELWADGAFVGAHAAKGDGKSTRLVMSANWVAPVAGSHVLVVRAFSNAGGEGQATVAVEAVGEAGADEMPTHVVKDGETWAKHRR